MAFWSYGGYIRLCICHQQKMLSVYEGTKRFEILYCTNLIFQLSYCCTTKQPKIYWLKGNFISSSQVLWVDIAAGSCLGSLMWSKSGTVEARVIWRLDWTKNPNDFFSLMFATSVQRAGWASFSLSMGPLLSMALAGS